MRIIEVPIIEEALYFHLAIQDSYVRDEKKICYELAAIFSSMSLWVRLKWQLFAEKMFIKFISTLQEKFAIERRENSTKEGRLFQPVK